MEPSANKLSTQLFMKLPKKLGCELCLMVWDDIKGQYLKPYYLLYIYLIQVLCIIVCSDLNKLDWHSLFANNYQTRIILPQCLGKTNYEIHNNYFLLLFWNWYSLKKTYTPLKFIFHLSAIWTVRHKFCYIFSSCEETNRVTSSYGTSWSHPEECYNSGHGIPLINS